MLVYHCVTHVRLPAAGDLDDLSALGLRHVGGWVPHGIEGMRGIPLRPSELVLPLYTKNEWKITIFKWKTYQISKHTKIIARISKHTKNYGKIHHFQWVNHGKSTISIGPFSIAMCNRGYTVSPILPNVRQFLMGDKSGF